MIIVGEVIRDAIAQFLCAPWYMYKLALLEQQRHAKKRIIRPLATKGPDRNNKIYESSDGYGRSAPQSPERQCLLQITVRAGVKERFTGLPPGEVEISNLLVPLLYTKDIPD